MYPLVAFLFRLWYAAAKLTAITQALLFRAIWSACCVQSGCMANARQVWGVAGLSAPCTQLVGRIATSAALRMAVRQGNGVKPAHNEHMRRPG